MQISKLAFFATLTFAFLLGTSSGMLLLDALITTKTVTAVKGQYRNLPLYTGDGDAMYARIDGAVYGPYAVNAEIHEGTVLLECADKANIEIFGRIMVTEPGTALLALRHKGNLYAASYQQVRYGLDAARPLLAITPRDSIGVIPHDKEYDAFCQYLPHLTVEEYAGTPLSSPPTTGLSLKELSRDMAARNQYGIILDKDVNSSEISVLQANASGDKKLLFSSWRHIVALNDGRRVYLFESPSPDYPGAPVDPENLQGMATEISPWSGYISARPGAISLWSHDKSQGFGTEYPPKIHLLSKQTPLKTP